MGFGYIPLEVSLGHGDRKLSYYGMWETWVNDAGEAKRATSSPAIPA